MFDNKFGEQGRVAQRFLTSSLSRIPSREEPLQHAFLTAGLASQEWECLSLGCDTHATSRVTSANQVDSSPSQIGCFVASHVHLHGHARAHAVF